MSGNRISLEEYRAVREGAAIGAVSARAPIAVAGTDRASFLQGLLSNDIVALTPGSGCYAAWLTAQGRMITDLHVLESGDLILLDVPAELAEATLQRLDQFVFSEDVQLASLAGALQAIWVHGPAAASVLQRTLAPAPAFDSWREYQHARLTFQEAPVVVGRISQLGVPGFCAYVAPEQSSAFSTALTGHGAIAVSQPVIDAARVEAAYPVFGVDMTEDTIPLEAGIEQRAISFSKGCYVGQEVIIRVLHRGGGRVARRLVQWRIDGEVPSHGASVHAGDRQIGFVTSGAWSPTHGAIALGYVHRDFTAPGTAAQVDVNGQRVAATVTVPSVS